MTIETDSLLMVNAIQKNIMYQLEVGTVIEACRTAFRERSIAIVHVKNLANNATHLMTRVPCLLNSYNVFESPP